MIRRLADVRGESQARQELEGYAYENQRDRNFRTETLGLRLSRRRFIQLLRTVLPGGGRNGGERAEGRSEDSGAASSRGMQGQTSQ